MSKKGSVSEEPISNEPISSACIGCKSEVIVGEKAVQCDLCNRWEHAGCCSMPDDLYRILKKYENKKTGVKWFCDTCEIHMGKVRMEIRVLAERQIKLELKQDVADSHWMEIKQEVMELKKELTDLKGKQQSADLMSVNLGDKMGALKDELIQTKQSYSDIVQTSRTAGREGTSVLPNALEKIIKVDVNELLERGKRKNNLVIFGIEETNDETVTRAKVSTIINALGLDDDKIKYFGRVGRLTTGAGARARIVRVVCEDAEVKRNCLKASNRLKSMEGYENIYMSLDLTKEQQLNDKKLREKLKEVREENREAKINNGEIVVFEHGDRKVIFSPNQ